MGFPESSLPASESQPVPVAGWNPFTSLAFRFFFCYWLLYSLPVILSFPTQLGYRVLTLSKAKIESEDDWRSVTFEYLSKPSTWLQKEMNEFTPRVSKTLLDVDVEPPKDPAGSGDRKFHYCTSFAYLMIAAAATLFWTVADEVWRKVMDLPRPNYDRLHVLLRLIVRFHLMYHMIGYGAAKVWCSQYPPILDSQLEVKYGDSSPMGLLWRFMQFSQPYTIAAGTVEVICGLLLISRRTTLLGALFSAGAALQVFMLNLCFDVPVKLLSGHLLLMALTLIAPDAKRLFNLFVLGRPVEPRPLTPLFGGWRWLNTAAVILRTVVFTAFAALSLYEAYRQATTAGILAPPNPAAGVWVTKEFLRDGQKVPFPEQPLNPPLVRLNSSTWSGGPDVPTVIRVSISPPYVSFVFEDNTVVGYYNTSEDPSELALTAIRGNHGTAQLQVTFPESDVMLLKGTVGGQQIQMTLRRSETPKREYLLRTRERERWDRDHPERFWIQEHPFNR